MKLIFIILVLLIHKISTNNTPFQYEHLLSANDPNNYIYFGQSISISGNTLAVGAGSNFYPDGAKPGRAYIFEQEKSNWNQKARLFASDGTNGDGFGESISISNDIVVIGAPNANVGNNTYQGKAYVFKKNGTDWNQVAELIASDGEAEDLFGYRVFISGKIIAIGSPNSNISGNSDQGCAYVFNGNEDGTIWNQTQKLIASDGEVADYFGEMISISSDSSLIVIGVIGADVGTNQNQGKTYIFQNNGTYWNQIQILTASDGQAGENFGSTTSISSDSSWMIIGAPSAKVGSNGYQGKAYIFQNNGNQWNQFQILTASDGQAYDLFGYSSSISIDSYWIVIGAPNTDSQNMNPQGKVYIFQKNGNQWDQVQILQRKSGDSSLFGLSLLISDSFVMVGSPGSDSSNGKYTESGNVYLINNTPLSSSSSKTTVIVCSTVIPVVVIVGVILTVFFIRKRRKRKQEQNSEEYSKLTQTN
ncbi:hypothetical protein M0811_06428 [Anaeramoeba ignava]|uniref:Uncharacterized protein n=1 Tax=Anaeramoeba ignava TaxID=1746090 RepID=A0A9Q0LP66_ANAIG|nr:hypothetical protein M0811_06428 [Anaeramoeba ignava]